MDGSKLFILMTIGLILALVGPQAFFTIRMLGYHKPAVVNSHPGRCWNVAGIAEGAEDFESVGDGKFLITSGLKWPVGKPVNPDTRGRVLLLDLNEETPEPVEVNIKGDLDLTTFNPIGMSKWVNKKIDKTTILIVNAIGEPQAAVVERFVYSELENSLHHVETFGLGDPNFHLVDDIVAVADRKFYFTNIVGQNAHWEMLFLLSWQTVGYFDGQSSTVVIEGASGPNGIAMSPDRTHIIINMCFSGNIKIYQRHPNNTLEETETFVVPFSPDNVLFDDSGDVWLAGSPILHEAMKYLEKPFEEKSASQVMRLKVKDGHVTSSETVFLDDGELHSGSTVALPYKNRILIGSVLSKATICETS